MEKRIEILDTGYIILKDKASDIYIGRINPILRKKEYEVAKAIIEEIQSSSAEELKKEFFGRFVGEDNKINHKGSRVWEWIEKVVRRMK